MAKKKESIPAYGKVTHNGVEYFRTRIYDADGKRVALYGETREELHKKVQEAKQEIADIIYRRNNPTVADYCEKWLKMQSAKIRPTTYTGYEKLINNFIIEKIGDMYLDEVTADDLRLIMLSVSKMSSSVYSKVNMLLKCIFYSAEASQVIEHNPAADLLPKGGKSKKEKVALTDEQVKVLIDTVKNLPPYLFVMIGLFAGLRKEEILALQWDCVFLGEKVPYISVRRAWHAEKNRAVVGRELKTPAAKREIPIPGRLVQCLKEAKEKSISEYVIADSKGNPLSESQFTRIWHYITVRSTGTHVYYKYLNGERIKYTAEHRLGEHQKNNPKIVYTIDFPVTPHLLRHTYITNLIHAGVDPKTVQYLAGHENSRVTMDIYAKVKYNKPQDLLPIVNTALE